MTCRACNLLNYRDQAGLFFFLAFILGYDLGSWG
jgi:hypothetical protein